MTRRISEEEYAARRTALVASLAEEPIDALVIGPGTDLRYFVGDGFRLNDRPVLLGATSNKLALLVPVLEAAELPELPSDIELVTWADGEDLVAVLLGHLGELRRLGLAHDVPFWVASRLMQQSGAEVVSSAALLTGFRAVKSETEIELMRTASLAADLAYEELQTKTLVGLRESEVSALIAELLTKHGCDPGTGGALVAAGANAAAPHHGAGDTVLQAGDVVIIDFGGCVDGYCSDTSRTFVLGEATADLANMHAVVLEANQAAFDAVRPGVAIQEIDRVARKVLEKHGLAEWFLHRTGHGIGLDVHEAPYVVEGDETVLAPGMMFTIEPGAYIHGTGGVRIEDVVLVTDDGAVSLNASSRDLFSLA